MSYVWAVTHTSRPQIKKKKRLLVRLINTTVAKRQTLLFSIKLVFVFLSFGNTLLICRSVTRIMRYTQDL